MSSTYYVLCMSHDPATVAAEASTPDSAMTQIRDGISGHGDCDLLIERVSGGPVEIGCPPATARGAGPQCSHRDTEWVDVEWLRLLGRAYTSTDHHLLDAIATGWFACWTQDRLHRLRQSLFEQEQQTNPTEREEGPSLQQQLAEAEALGGRWEAKYFEMGEKRSEALAAIDRVQALAREWEFMSGRREARRELLARLDAPAGEQR